MLQDGAHLGVSAGRALDTILGSKPSPEKEERMPNAEFAEWIRSAPHILKDTSGDNGYTDASRWLARRYLLLLDEGCEADSHKLWDSFEAKWPDDADEAGGMTGFMHGWAFNAAKHALNLPPSPNPALLTLEVKE